MIPEGDLFLMWEVKQDSNGELADHPSVDPCSGLCLWCLQQPCLTSYECVAMALPASIKSYDA